MDTYEKNKLGAELAKNTAPVKGKIGIKARLKGAAMGVLGFALAAIPGIALAQEGGIAGVADTVFEQLDSLGTLLIGAAFLLGVGLVFAGLLKLKQAADTQGQQVKYSDGVWRLVIGVALVSLLFFTDVGVNTFGGETNAELSGGGGLNFGGGGS